MPNLSKEQELELLDLRERELMLMKQKEQMQPAPSRGALPPPAPSKEHEITDADLKGATQGLQVRPEVMKDARRLVPFFGGSIKGEEAPLGQRVLGFLGDSLAFGLPQKAFIESQYKDATGLAKFYRNVKSTLEGDEAVSDLTEDEVNYIDRVRQMAVAKKGWGQWLAEAGTGLIVPGGLVGKMSKGATFGTKAAVAAAEGAAVGGAAGVGYSPRGQELEGGLTGAAIGGTLGAGLQGLFSGIGWLRNRGPADTATQVAVAKNMERLNVDEVSQKLQLKGQELDESIRVMQAESKQIGGAPRKFLEAEADNLELAALARVEGAVGELTYLRDKTVTVGQFRKVLEDSFGSPKIIRKNKKAWQETIANAQMTAAAIRDKTLAGGGPIDYLTRPNLTILKLQQMKKAVKPNEVVDAMANMWKYETLYKKMPTDLRRGLGQLLRTSDSSDFVPKKILADLDDYVKNKMQGDYMKRAVREEIQKTGKDLPVMGPGFGWFKLFSDGKPIQMLIDNRYQVNMSRMIDDLDTKTVLMHNLGNELAEEVKDMAAAGKFSKNRASGPTQDMRDFYRKVRHIFNSKSVGLNIDDFGPDYIPKVFKSPKRLVLDVSKEAKKAIKAAGGDNELRKMTPQQLKDWLEANPAYNELVLSLEILTGKKMQPGGEGLYQLMKDFRYRPTEFRAKMSTLARSEQLRKDIMPDLITEQDPYEATIKYIQNSLRHATFKDAIPKLANIRDVAIEANDKEIAEYLNGMITDMLGTRTEGNRIYRLGKQTSEAIEKYHLNKAIESKNPRQQEWHMMMADLPGILRATNANVYPSFIGMSPRAIFQNSISPFYMNLGSLGPRYGSQVATEALFETMKTVGSREGMEAMVERLGLVEKEFKGELSQALESGLTESAVFKASEEAVKWWSKMSMFLFNKSEKFARIQNWNMAKRVGEDLVRAVKGADDFRAKKALSFLEDMPDRSYREALIKLVRDPDLPEEQIVETIQRYMNAQSMFNYTKANMSEFGRTMGPIFSVFTKWPSTMWGKVYQQLYDEGKISGGSRLAKFFLYPLVAAQIADGVMYDVKDEPMYKTLVGSRGMTGATPAASLAMYTTGEFLTPPVTQAVGGMFQGVGYIGEGEARKGLRKIEQSVSGFVPYYNFYPFFNQKVPGLFNMEPIGPKTITDAVLED